MFGWRRVPPYLLSALFIMVTSGWCVAQTLLKTSRNTTTDHCSLTQGNPYDDSVGCLVWDRKPFGDSEARQIEIYKKGELRRTIEPGDPIREWHFCEHGRRMAVAFGAMGALRRYALYDVASGEQVDSVFGGEMHLPQWAKSRSQLEDEAVPEDEKYRQERALWLAKVLRQLDQVRVGMRRKDLAIWLIGEGGVSFRTERTYVSAECPYIKMDLKFKAEADGTDESPEDLVVGVSKAYLGWSVKD